MTRLERVVRLGVLALGPLAVPAALAHATVAERAGVAPSGVPMLAEEQTMEIVVRLRPETARAFLSGPDVRDASGAAEVEAVLRRFGVALRPQHPGISAPELASYFTISSPSPAQAEEIAAALRQLDAVEAAYVKPPAAPA